MGIVDQFWYAWPWMGLGAAVVMVVLLFCTNACRSTSGPRWRDLQWLAWLALPLYLVHQFEEYSCNLTDGGYVIINQVFANTQGIFDLSALPMAHFPLVNILLVWFAVPLAAWLYHKSPVIALSPYGFILVNGLMHFAMTVVRGVPVSENPGFFTGTFLFIPVTIWVIYVAVKNKSVGVKGIVIALVAGALAHLMLGAAYAVSAVAGAVGTYIFDFLAGFSCIIFSWLGVKLFMRKPRA